MQHSEQTGAIDEVLCRCGDCCDAGCNAVGKYWNAQVLAIIIMDTFNASCLSKLLA